MALSSPSITLTTLELVTVIVSVGLVILLVVIAYRYVLHLKKKRQSKSVLQDVDAQCVDLAPLEEVNIHPRHSGYFLENKDIQTTNLEVPKATCKDDSTSTTNTTLSSDKEQSPASLTQSPDHEGIYPDASKDTASTPSSTGTSSPAQASPSTARLEDYMDDSVSLFSFFKGHRSNTTQSSSSAPGSLMTNPPVKMPVLTRTVARSATRPHLSPLNTCSTGTGTGTTSSSGRNEHRPAVTPAMGSGRWLSSSGSKNANKPNLRLLALQASSAAVAANESNGPGPSIPSSPSTAMDMAVNRSCTSSTSNSTLSLPHQQHVRESSSVMALYGSPSSSPNGSAADVASVQALYCRSLRSIAASTATCTQDDASSIHENHE